MRVSAEGDASPPPPPRPAQSSTEDLHSSMEESRPLSPMELWLKKEFHSLHEKMAQLAEAVARRGEADHEFMSHSTQQVHEARLDSMEELLTQILKEKAPSTKDPGTVGLNGTLLEELARFQSEQERSLKEITHKHMERVEALLPAMQPRSLQSHARKLRESSVAAAMPPPLATGDSPSSDVELAQAEVFEHSFSVSLPWIKSSYIDENLNLPPMELNAGTSSAAVDNPGEKSTAPSIHAALAVEDVKDLEAARGWRDVNRWTLESLPDTRSSRILNSVTRGFTKDFIFKVSSMSLVIGNAIFVGFEIQHGMDYARRQQPLPKWVDWVEIGFSCAFTVELTLHLYISRWNFFLGKDRNWNLFDLVIVVNALLDIAIKTFDLSITRILRIFHVFRAARIIRSIRFVRELRLMVASIICCLQPMCWAFALGFVILYLFSVVCMQGAAEYINEREAEDYPPDLVKYWGSLPQAMLSLFMAVSGGVDWRDILEPLTVISDYYYLVFVCYISFTVYAFLNVLTAIFVESGRHIAEIDHDLVIQEEINNHTSTVNQLRKIFHSADTDKSGTLTAEELEIELLLPKTRACLRLLELNVSEARGLFRLLSAGGEEVQIDEFVSAMMRLKGAAKSVDVATVIYENKKIFLQLKALGRYIEDSFSILSRTLRSEQAEAIRRYVAHEVKRAEDTL